MRKSIARLCLGLVVLLLSGPVRAGGLEDAEALLEDNRTTAAMTLLRSHIEEHPEDVAAHELLIDILINAKLFEEAEEIYRSRKDDDTSSADAWYLLGRTLMNPESAQSAYEQAIQLSPGHPRATMGRAAIFRATGRYPEAMTEYRAALRQDPTLAEAWVGLWASQGMADDMEGALQTARQAAEAIPKTVEPWLVIAELDPNSALTTLRSGAANNPESARIWTELARRSMRARSLSTSASAYSQSIRLSPSDRTLRIEAAMLEEITVGTLDWDPVFTLLDTRAAPRSPETLAALDVVVADWPRSPLARMIRGNTLQMQGDVASAEDDLRLARQLSPTNPEIASSLGLLLLGDRRPGDAQPHLSSAWKARSDDVALGIALAISLAEGSDPGAGGLLLLELQEKFPASAGPPMTLAQLLIDLGEAERAYSILLEAIQRSPDPNLIIALASAAQLAGRPVEAAGALSTLSERTGDPRFAEAGRQLLTSSQ
ncbi:MAG: tetratricopeptide repeat protein [Myxococcota bacterium]|nr:tetratricopeptide repeat protein [Myxococcota bacterium]